MISGSSNLLTSTSFISVDLFFENKLLIQTENDLKKFKSFSVVTCKSKSIERTNKAIIKAKSKRNPPAKPINCCNFKAMNAPSAPLNSNEIKLSAPKSLISPNNVAKRKSPARK